MPPEAKQALSGAWRLTDWLSGGYYALAIVATLVGLVVWTVKQEARISELERSQSTQDQRLSDLDIHGTRALSKQVDVLIAQVRSDTETENRRITAVADRLNTWETTLRKVDVIEARQLEVMRRLEIMEHAHQDGRQGR